MWHITSQVSELKVQYEEVGSFQGFISRTHSLKHVYLVIWGILSKTSANVKHAQTFCVLIKDNSVNLLELSDVLSNVCSGETISLLKSNL